MDSICLTWIEQENRYRVTILTSKDGLLTKYVNTIQDFIELMKKLEVNYAA